MLPPDALPNGDRGWPADEIPVHVKINGTTFRATYEVRGDAVLLASPEFGDKQAALDGRTPDETAARLLQRMAEAAVAHSRTPFVRDNDTNPHGG